MTSGPSDICVKPQIETDPRPAVLVVEDEVLVRMDVAEQLRSANLVVLEAADADEALSVLGSGAKVDVVLSDIELPGTMDGLQLIRLVRERYPALKLIACSGHITSRDDLPPSAVHVDAYFPKPYSSTEVVQRIRQLLEQAK